MKFLWGFDAELLGEWVYFRANNSSEIAKYIVEHKHEHDWIEGMCDIYKWDVDTLDYETVYNHIHYLETDDPSFFRILEVIDV